MQETLLASFNYKAITQKKGFQLTRKGYGISLSGHSFSVNKKQTVRTAQTNHVLENVKNESVFDNLPAKVLQNCQRTGRVIIISELEKKLNKDKKYRIELHKILSEFLPKHMDQEIGDYCESKKYYQSLNYSRVRIGHKQFIKKILNNSVFHQLLSEIFDSDTLYNSDKARKNERSPISFEKRKQILEKVLLDYKAKFLSLNQKQQCCNQSSTILQSCHLLEEKEEIIQQFVPSFKFFPLIPIPLKPSSYEKYMASKTLDN